MSIVCPLLFWHNTCGPGWSTETCEFIYTDFYVESHDLLGNILFIPYCFTVKFFSDGTWVKFNIWTGFYSSDMQWIFSSIPSLPLGDLSIILFSGGWNAIEIVIWSEWHKKYWRQWWKRSNRVRKPLGPIILVIRGEIFWWFSNFNGCSFWIVEIYLQCNSHWYGNISVTFENHSDYRITGENHNSML